MTPEEPMESALVQPQMNKWAGEGLDAPSSAGDRLWGLPLFPSLSSGSSSKIATAWTISWLESASVRNPLREDSIRSCHGVNLDDSTARWRQRCWNSN
jgi:hypothetical protein